MLFDVSVKEIITMVDFKVPKSKSAVSEQWRRNLIRCGFSMTVVLALGLFLLAGCTATNRTLKSELTPVTDSPTGVHHQGKFVWNDLLTDDVPSAKVFYSQLFGWTFEQSGTYAVIKNDGESIGGMAQINTESETKGVARWLSVLSVADVDAAVSLVIEEGGTVHTDPLVMPNRGRGALVRDPQGAQLVLLNAYGGDPEDKEPVVGSWLWHELWSNTSEVSLTFYQKLAGYSFLGEKHDYLVLLRDGHWRAGIRYIEDDDLEIRWVPVVRVDNTEEIATRTKRLGGKVLVEPRPTESGGSVMLLSDPSGALLLAQRWSAEATKREK